MVLIAIAQIRSTDSLRTNLETCTRLVRQASTQAAKAIFFPEASDYICSDRDRCAQLCQTVHVSPYVRGLRRLAKEYMIPIAVGIHEPSTDTDDARTRNTMVWISEQGEIIHRYEKLHMVEMNIPGGPEIHESDFCQPGQAVLPPFDSPIGRIGAMICYDLRFPSLAQRLVSMGAEVLLYPSAFVPTTGRDHWLPLLQARAIECQAYVIAPDQVGKHNEQRSSYGHSVVVDPWGKIVAQLESEEDQLMFAEIDRKQVQLVRESLPLVKREEDERTSSLLERVKQKSSLALTDPIHFWYHFAIKVLNRRAGWYVTLAFATTAVYYASWMRRR